MTQRKPLSEKALRAAIEEVAEKGGGSPKWVKLETQFPEGEPIPFALHQERQKLLNAPIPVAGGKYLSAVIRAYRTNRKFTHRATPRPVN